MSGICFSVLLVRFPMISTVFVCGDYRFAVTHEVTHRPSPLYTVSVIRECALDVLISCMPFGIVHPTYVRYTINTIKSETV